MFWVLKRTGLIETVLLSTHNICFGWEMRKIIFKLHTFIRKPCYNNVCTSSTRDTASLYSECPSGSWFIVWLTSDLRSDTAESGCKSNFEFWKRVGIFINSKEYSLLTSLSFFMLYIQVNFFSVMSGWFPVFLKTSTKQQKVSCSNTQHSDSACSEFQVQTFDSTNWANVCRI